MDEQGKYIVKLFPEINDIKDEALRKLVVDAWLLSLQESDWKHIEDMPWVPGKADFITNVQHCRSVARIGLAITKSVLSGNEGLAIDFIDQDVVLAGCLLHDIGKLLEYAPPPNPPGEKTPLGRYMKHHILGAYIAIKAGLPAEVVHCIESHFESESFQRSYEAKIVHWSDMAHADAMIKAHPGTSIF